MFLRVKNGENEIVIKKSRFIAVSRGIDSRDDVKRIVDELKAAHREARHVCYGFIADETGLDFGYDDNGEPNGTAGKPIYSALEASGARKSLIAVVRYFGGIKLGAGGLTRAYRESATGVIEKAGLVRAERYSVYDVSCDGETYKKILPILRNSCKTEHILFSDRVSLTAVVKADSGLADRLVPLGADVRYTGDRIMDSEELL